MMWSAQEDAGTWIPAWAADRPEQRPLTVICITRGQRRHDTSSAYDLTSTRLPRDVAG